MHDYDVQRSIHDEIAVLYPAVEMAKCYFRSPAPDTSQSGTLTSPRTAVDRDRAICAIMNKLVTTQQAILTLCDARLGSDAFALSRVALENAVIVMWLLDKDNWCERVDTYVNSHSQARVRLNDVVQEYQPDTPLADRLRESTTEEDREITKNLFDSTPYEWRFFRNQRYTFRRMAQEVFHGHFVNDRIYLETSWFVHSAYMSCYDIVLELAGDDVYNLSIRRNGNMAADALLLGNLAILMALHALNNRTPLGLSEHIERLFTRVRDGGQGSEAQEEGREARDGNARKGVVGPESLKAGGRHA